MAENAELSRSQENNESSYSSVDICHDIANLPNDLERPEVLKYEIKRLRKEIASLNENTVIESMKDMKIRHEKMVDNSICACTARMIVNEKRNIERYTVAIGSSAYMMLDALPNMLLTTAKTKQEVSEVEWRNLHKKLTHLDHVLLHVTDLYDETECLQDIEDDFATCICGEFGLRDTRETASEILRSLAIVRS